MKKILLFVLVTCFCFSGFGQLLTEGFEGTFPPTDWVLKKNSGNFWTQNTSSSYAKSGSKSAKYGYNSSPADSWVMSKGLTLTSGTTYKLSFGNEFFQYHTLKR